VSKRTIRNSLLGVAISACLGWSWPLAAVELLFRDSQGAALADAVVLVPGVAATAVATPAVMDQIDRQFSPHVLVVQSGQAVSFPNSDAIRHHVYSFSRTKPFEIRLYSGVPSAPVVFEQPGIVVLGCNIHDSMVGYIVVAPGQLALQSAADGRLQLPEAARGQTLQVWHPRQRSGIERLQALTLPAGAGPLPVTLDVNPPRDGAPDTFGNRFQSPAP
jgi:plastocyanin